MSDEPKDNVNWNLATWEGATDESLRRWSELPLERIIAALEEMQTLNEALHGATVPAAKAQSVTDIREQRSDYERGVDDKTSDK